MGRTERTIAMIGGMRVLAVGRPRKGQGAAADRVHRETNEVACVEPFESYPAHGREPLGPPSDTTGACRSGYGLAFQRLTGQTTCAYCGLSLVDSYEHWLLMSIDHVVPRADARRLGIPADFVEDVVNIVLCCAGCNGFGNRYRSTATPRSEWTLDAFLELRDRIYAERFQAIATRRGVERTFFASQPWATKTSTDPFVASE